MFNLRFSRRALGSGLTVALLAGCGARGTSLNPSSAGLEAERSHSGPAYSVLHSFGGSGDGSDPASGFNKINGTLYGTTQQGGANGYGTVYTITTSGTETVLYSFKGGPSDGSYPGALIIINGTLYGTTSGGGANGDGTVFTITTSGTEKVLYSFKGGPSDGSAPVAGLLNVNGTLYGTTSGGGANGDGTVFSMTQTGQEKVLHSFGGSGDGTAPYAGLTNVNGTLYGTTVYGGTTGSARRDGTVFSITKTGKEKVLHSFKGRPSDGKGPEATLINVNGTLYGTTGAGGANNYGTVFRITTSGTETVLYSFKGGLVADGSSPSGRFVNVNGTLYGTTAYGGAYGSGYGHNYGTVFGITTSGMETVLHSFEGAPTDGKSPSAGLLYVNGTLFGTTVYGSANGYGDAGTVFALTP